MATLGANKSDINELTQFKFSELIGLAINYIPMAQDKMTGVPPRSAVFTDTTIEYMYT